MVQNVDIVQGDRSSRSHPSKRDRKRLSKLDKQISSIKKELRLLKILCIHTGMHEKELIKLDTKRKNLRNKMKGYEKR